MGLPFDREPTPRIVAYIDGGARGNPGPAGFGVRIEREDGTLIEEFCAAIGAATNNVAEYRALIAALEWAGAHGHGRVHIRSDSLLLVQQMLGHYKVKHPGLQPLHAKANLLAASVGMVTFEHVPRAMNAHADRLANAAMDGVPCASADSTAANLRGPRTPAPAPAPHAFTPLERAVRAFVFRTFADTGRAPALSSLVAHTRADERSVAAALRTLADAHALVLAPATLNIWMAHPFSAVPTPYPVMANGKNYWANCAWDAAGILSLLGDGESQTRCADCGAELVMTVRGGRMMGDGVVHYAVPPRRFWENVAFT